MLFSVNEPDMRDANTPEQAAKLLQGENYSVDIMIGLHDHTVEQVQESLRVALNYGASHVSMYALTPEDGTPLYTDYLNGELPDGDTVAELYEAGVAYLKSRGLRRYEVSNFARDGYQSRHNLNYWKRGEYLGFGKDFWSWDRIFDTLDDFCGEEEHEIKFLEPRVDFFPMYND